MEAADLSPNAVIRQRILDLTGDVPIDITKPISNQPNHNQRGPGADQAYRYEDGVASRDETTARADRRRRPGILSLIFAGAVAMVIYGHGCRPSRDLIKSKFCRGKPKSRGQRPEIR